MIDTAGLIFVVMFGICFYKGMSDDSDARYRNERYNNSVYEELKFLRSIDKTLKERLPEHGQK